MNKYILIWNPGLRIVGPFPTDDAIWQWGKTWQKINGDNPCWTSIEFDIDKVNRFSLSDIIISIEKPNG